MVKRLTDEGVVVGRLPWPGLSRLLPFEEIAAAEAIKNGRPRLRLTLHDAGAVEVGCGADAEAEALAAAVREVIDPVAARPGRKLTTAELQDTIAGLCGGRFFKPSALLRLLVDQAERLRATDLHFDAAGPDFAASARVDGLLHRLAVIPEAGRERFIAHLKSAAGLASYRRDVPQEGRISLAAEDGSPREIRLSVLPANASESLALRLFDALRGNLALTDLGFSPATIEAYLRLLGLPLGMILITGPSSSGKTTTIYSSLRHMMAGPRAGQKAVSLEDPVEYPLSCVSQVEAKPDRGMGFDELLSRVLRQDAEIIMVGEIRDQTTAAIAVRAALTGHLIISTVHCGSAFEAPRRLVNLGAAPSAVAEALRGALAQRLLRKVCAGCAETRPATAEETEAARPHELSRVTEGRGCDACMGSGYLGRTVAAELMTGGGHIAELISMNAPASELRAAALAAGGHDLAADVFGRVAAGVTDFREARRVLGL